MGAIKKFVVELFEDSFYHPTPIHRLLSITLLPLSLIYASVMLIRRVAAKQEEFEIPIISIGNLIVGGSGKTPFLISLAKQIDSSRITIISRGYGRESRGLVVVSEDGEIKSDVANSGDEPFLIAKELKESSVIVSEDRKEAIKEAIKRGAEVIILDDGFNRVDIKKFEIVLEPKDIPNSLPLPSGPFREFRFSYRYANMLLKEAKEYNRKVKCINCTKKMVLATAIANPKRLDRFLPKRVVAKVYKPDHERFGSSELRVLIDKYQADSILMTQKDAIKIDDESIPISILDLEIEIKQEIIDKVNRYIKDFYAKED